MTPLDKVFNIHNFVLHDFEHPTHNSEPQNEFAIHHHEQSLVCISHNLTIMIINNVLLSFLYKLIGQQVKD